MTMSDHDGLEPKQFWEKDIEEIRVYVPILLNIVQDGCVLNDRILWDARDNSLTVDVFSRITCLDLGLPDSFIPEIEESMNSQVEKAKELMREIDSTKPHVVPIFLDLSVGSIRYRDQFLFNLSDKICQPSKFADLLVAEMSLPVDFAPLITWEIWYQAIQKPPNVGDWKAQFRNAEQIKHWSPYMESTLTEDSKNIIVGD
ncbi:hypothetical protein PCE1_003022 [Barthelona sp. PCE]